MPLHYRLKHAKSRDNVSSVCPGLIHKSVGARREQFLETPHIYSYIKYSVDIDLNKDPVTFPVTSIGVLTPYELKSGRSLRMTTHLHLVQRPTLCGVSVRVHDVALRHSSIMALLKLDISELVYKLLREGKHRAEYYCEVQNEIQNSSVS